MSKPLTIVVGGYIVGFPLGGMSWHHLNYLLGLAELGHEVWFLEDSGSYSIPYNPRTWTCQIQSDYGRDYLTSTFAAYGLPPQWCYYSEFENRYYGLNETELNDLLGRADLLLCVSGVTPIRPHRPRPRRMAAIDTDPVFTQLRMINDAEFADYYRQFDAVATFGRLIGQADCPLPTHGLNWIPTQQPISLRHWPVVPSSSRRFSTVGKWEHSAERHYEFAGKKYHSSKSAQWMKLLDMPSQSPFELELGMQQMPADVAGTFAEHGWHLFDPEQSTLCCQAYQQYIQSRAGELTVAKEIYAGLPSGWFSDRSAAFLASGRPVITQASGFDRWLPTGEGLFSFQTPQQATEALRQIHGNYEIHAAAARSIAVEYFDSQKVLGQLLAAVL